MVAEKDTLSIESAEGRLFQDDRMPLLSGGQTTNELKHIAGLPSHGGGHTCWPGRKLAAKDLIRGALSDAGTGEWY